MAIIKRRNSDEAAEIQTEEAARMIISEFYYFKLSEFMLFFAYFKGGRYGRFYGCTNYPKCRYSRPIKK